MIDLNKAGAWSEAEQLEIAELLRNPSDAMERAGYKALIVNGAEGSADDLLSDTQVCFKAMIDAATGGESDER